MNKSKTPNYTKAALVTGGSSGIGLAFTEELLLKRGGWGDYDAVVVAARNSKRLKGVIAELHKQNGKLILKLIPLVIDLSKSGAILKTMNFIKRNRLQITVLINNAGIGYMGDFTAMSEEKIQEIITLNITTLTKLSQAILNHIRNQPEPPLSHPIIINVASVIGFLPFPLSAVYAASKAYVVSFSEALRAECREEVYRPGHREQGVEVYTLCPGSTKTSFFERARKGQRELLTTDHFMDPSEVVAVTRKAIAYKQGLIIPGTANRFIPLLVRLLPRRTTVWLSHLFMKRRLK